MVINFREECMDVRWKKQNGFICLPVSLYEGRAIEFNLRLMLTKIAGMVKFKNAGVCML